MIDTLLDVSADFHILGTPDRTKLLNPGDFLTESHATRAMDAASHVRGYQRSEILVFYDAFLFGVARHVAAVSHRQILQLAFTALVADRAVQRMVDQQEFHRRLLCGSRFRRACEYFHALANRRRAGDQRFRRVVDLDQAHAAVGSDAQLFVITESRDVDTDCIGDLHDHLALPAFDRFAVNFKFYDIVTHEP